MMLLAWGTVFKFAGDLPAGIIRVLAEQVNTYSERMADTGITWLSHVKSSVWETVSTHLAFSLH